MLTLLSCVESKVMSHPKQKEPNIRDCLSAMKRPIESQEGLLRYVFCFCWVTKHRYQVQVDRITQQFKELAHLFFQSVCPLHQAKHHRINAHVCLMASSQFQFKTVKSHASKGRAAFTPRGFTCLAYYQPPPG